MIRKTEGVKLAVIDNSINASIYTPVVHWSRWLDVPWESFRAKKRRLPDLDQGTTHLILTGSEASILERESWVDEEIALVRKAADLGLAILGSCYGHQLLAVALRGPAAARRCPHPEIGWISINVPETDDLLGAPGVYHVFSSHFDDVVNLDADFRIIASTGECPVQGFQWKGKPVWGIQSHPEIDIRSGRTLLKRSAVRNSEAGPLFEKALKQTPRDSGLISRIVRRFLESRPML